MSEWTTSLRRDGVLTGWGSDDGEPTSVTVHAVARSDADRHRALCGANLPVIDRTRPWAGQGTRCCAGCRDVARRAA